MTVNRKSLLPLLTKYQEILNLRIKNYSQSSYISILKAPKVPEPFPINPTDQPRTHTAQYGHIHPTASFHSLLRETTTRALSEIRCPRKWRTLERIAENRNRDSSRKSDTFSPCGARSFPWGPSITRTLPCVSSIIGIKEEAHTGILV